MKFDVVRFKVKNRQTDKSAIEESITNIIDAIKQRLDEAIKPTLVGINFDNVDSTIYEIPSLNDPSQEFIFAAQLYDKFIEVFGDQRWTRVVEIAIPLDFKPFFSIVIDNKLVMKKTKDVCADVVKAYIQYLK